MPTGQRKINAELQQIWGSTPEDTMRKRTAWIQQRGSRIQFIQELLKQGLKGKEYSDRVAAYDREANAIARGWK